MEYKPGCLDEIKFNLDEKSKEDIVKAYQFNESQKKDLLVDSLPAGNVSDWYEGDCGDIRWHTDFGDIIWLSDTQHRGGWRFEKTV